MLGSEEGEHTRPYLWFPAPSAGNISWNAGQTRSVSDGAWCYRTPEREGALRNTRGRVCSPSIGQWRVVLHPVPHFPGKKRSGDHRSPRVHLRVSRLSRPGHVAQMESDWDSRNTFPVPSKELAES